MRKHLKACILGTSLLVTASAWGQGTGVTQPMIKQGDHELEVAGSADFEGPTGGVDWSISAGYGYFFVDNLEAGVRGRYQRSHAFDDKDVDNVSLGLFSEYNIPAAPVFVPFLGASVNWSYFTVEDGPDDHAFLVSPYAGIKWFLRDYVAISPRVFFEWASEDQFINDGEAEDTNWGAELGLRVFFH